jgi:osmoprotectant transport system permease protein
MDWFRDPAQWVGATSVQARVVEHLQITSIAVLAALLVALPAGLIIGHTKRGEFIVTSVANAGRAVPSFAILALMLPITIRAGLGLGFWPTVIALFVLAIPPILTNAHVGVKEVDTDVVEAARGMGFSNVRILTRIELPLAVPVLLAGVRTAVVQAIATATLAALGAWGGLGRYIIDGFAIGDMTQITAGAILVAALAIVAEIFFGGVQRILAPKTRSHPSRAPRGLTPAPN